MAFAGAVFAEGAFRDLAGLRTLIALASRVFLMCEA